MPDNRPLSALSYLSVFFAPLLVPILVYFLSKDDEVRSHSKNALISHIFPFISVVIAFFLFIGAIFTNNDAAIGGAAIFAVFAIVVVNIGVVIYNIYKAIRLYV